MSNLMFVDANIFMYAAGKPHLYKQPCVQILDRIENHKIQCVTNTEVLQELWYRYSAIDLADKGIQLCREILQLPVLILSITEADIGLALNLFDEYRTRGVKTRDAIHAANMKLHDIFLIISADQHFDHIEFIERVDPLDIHSKLV